MNDNSFSFWNDGKTIALDFPGNARFCFVAGTWSKRAGRIYATFTHEQLQLCLDVMQPLTASEQIEHMTRKRATLRQAR
jgi:hypothetical protein